MDGSVILITIGALTTLALVLFVPWRSIFAKFSSNISFPGANNSWKILASAIAAVIIAAIIYSYWEDIAKLDFATLFVLAVAIYIIGRLIKSGANIGLKSAPYYAGLAAIALVLWFNGAGDVVKLGLNSANDAATSVADGKPIFEYGCPDIVMVSGTKKPSLSLRRNCTQKVIHTEGMDPRFMIIDSRFTGSINDHVDIKYVAHNTLTLTPKDSFPVNGEAVEVAVMTLTEANSITSTENKQGFKKLFGSYEPK